MFFSCIALTIWSLSGCLTRESLAPWPISSGLLIFATWVSGERSSSNLRPASVRGSPTRLANCSKNAAQYGGIVASKVLRLDGPTMSTPHLKVSGVKVRPVSVA